MTEIAALQSVELGAFDPSFVGRKASHGGQQCTDRTLLAKRSHAHGFELGLILCGCDLAENLGLKCGDIGHANSGWDGRLDERPAESPVELL